jgi:hypothetical protein
MKATRAAPVSVWDDAAGLDREHDPLRDPVQSELANHSINVRFGGRLDDRALEGDLWKLRSVQEDGRAQRLIELGRSVSTEAVRMENFTEEALGLTESKSIVPPMSLSLPTMVLKR